MTTEEKKLTEAQETAREMVGDGKLPNKYWVSIGTNFFTNKENRDDPENSNCYDNAGEVYADLPERGETFGPFDTFEAAKEKYDELTAECADPSDEFDAYHCVTIEDRLSGQLYEGSWRETWRPSTHRFPRAFHEWTENDDTEYTRAEMKKRGVEFI